MGKFFNLILVVVRIILVVVVGLAIYAWAWLPGFQDGTRSGPYWLLTLYDRYSPLLLRIALVGIVIVLIYRFFVYLLPGARPAPRSSAFMTLLLWIVVVGALGMLPAVLSDYVFLESTAFGRQNYHLILRQDSQTARYLVYKCSDPIGFWCKRVQEFGGYPPVPPTPDPELFPTAESNNPLAIAPTPFPTVTPPAFFITDSTGWQQLAVQIGGSRQVVTTAITATTGIPLPPPVTLPEIITPNP